MDTTNRYASKLDVKGHNPCSGVALLASLTLSTLNNSGVSAFVIDSKVAVHLARKSYHLEILGLGQKTYSAVG